MPNYCDNNVFLQHEDDSMIERAEQAFNRGELISEFFPCPKELTETVSGYCGEGTYAQELLDFKQKLNIKWFGSANWFDWAVSNWGTKWDVGVSGGGGDGYVSRSPNSLTLSFMSAWSPPTGFYEKLEDLGFTVKAYYYEGGCAFCGIWENNIDEQYSIDGNAKWVTENIPAVLDNEFCISSNMAEWNCQELQELIDELEQKITGEGCEETCKKYRKKIEELSIQLKEIEELIND